MTLDKFTIKAQEAIQEAVNTAQMNGQQVIEPVHILKGMLEKAKDVVTFIFQKLGVNAQQIEMLTEQEIKHLPRVQGAGQPYLSNEANQVLVKATDISQKMGDEFVVGLLQFGYSLPQCIIFLCVVLYIHRDRYFTALNLVNFL